METPAAARRPKRRKLEAPEIPEQEGETNVSPLPVPATSVPDSSSPSGPRIGDDEPTIQDTPPGAGTVGDEEKDGFDRISRLPDAIFGEIIYLLPTKDAARTRMLATRWRHLWRSAPLNLDVDDGDVRVTVDVVSRILSAHQGPGRRFRFRAQHLQDHPATVDAWLQCRALDNLQEIDVFTDGLRLLPPPPASAFRFSSSLCVATFSQCHLSDDITQELQFPCLKKLALERVVISKDSLHSIVAASPVLEGLLLSRILGCRCVRINSASLTSIGVSAGYDSTITRFQEFIVDDAPSLQRIVYLGSPRRDMGLRVSVISAPNLETLGCLSFADRGSSRLALGSMIIEPCSLKEFSIINSTTMPACTVKILAVCISTLSLDVIIDLLRCFPCLEKLYIQSYYDRGKNLWRRKHRNLIKGLDIRLKTVVLNKHYRGIKSQVDFATFFVLNAKMLESMTFQCGYGVTAGFLAEQHQLLQLDKRASRRARFCFASEGCCHDFLHINHAHDLSISDPFECVEAGGGACLSFEQLLAYFCTPVCC